jgi:hypothetical protein
MARGIFSDDFGEEGAGDSGPDVADVIDRECLTGELGPVETWLVRFGAATGILRVYSICITADAEIGLAGSWATDESAPTADLWVGRLDPATGAGLQDQIR